MVTHETRLNYYYYYLLCKSYQGTQQSNERTHTKREEKTNQINNLYLVIK